MVQVMRREEIPRFSSRESKSHQILTGVNLKLQSLNHKFWASTYHQPILEQSLPHYIRSFLWFLQRLQFQKLVFCGLDTCHVSFKVMDFIFVHGGSDELALVIGTCPSHLLLNKNFQIAFVFGFISLDPVILILFSIIFVFKIPSLHQGKPRLHDASTRWSISLL